MNQPNHAARKVRGAWSSAEDQVLRDNFPQGGVPVCAPLLPERTGCAIHDRARELKLRNLVKAVSRSKLQINAASVQAAEKLISPRFGLRGAKPPPWSPSEDAIIKERYPDGGFTSCIDHLPGRARQSIITRACILDVKSNYDRNEWTPAEDATMRAHFPWGGWSACVDHLPGRNRPGVTARAVHLRLRCLVTSTIQLTTAQYAALMEFATYKTRIMMKDLAVQLELPIHLVRSRVMAMRRSLAPPVEPPSEEEEAEAANGMNHGPSW